MLGTLVEIGAVGANATAGIEAAFREIETVHHLMSFHEESSDVSHINRASPREIVQINPRTYEVLSCARMISRLSAGAFDVTVGGKLVEQGVLPRPYGSQSFDEEASFEDVVLLRNNLVKVKRRLWIDLGGIAKGYAVDRAVKVLKNNAVVSGIVNAGGDLYVFGDPQPIHIRHPEDASLVLPLGFVVNSAVASSSGCFAHAAHGGKATEPLIDPKRNTSVRCQQGITMIAARCVIADALTKVVRLAPRRAPRILARLGAQAIVTDRRGVRMTKTHEVDEATFGFSNPAQDRFGSESYLLTRTQKERTA